MCLTSFSVVGGKNPDDGGRVGKLSSSCSSGQTCDPCVGCLSFLLSSPGGTLLRVQKMEQGDLYFLVGRKFLLPGVFVENLSCLCSEWIVKPTADRYQ